MRKIPVLSVLVLLLGLSACKDALPPEPPVFMHRVDQNGPSCGEKEFIDFTLNGTHFYRSFTAEPGICVLALCNTLSYQTLYEKTLFGKILPMNFTLDEFVQDYPFDLAQPVSDSVTAQFFMVFNTGSMGDLQPGAYKVGKDLGSQNLPGVEFFLNLDFWNDARTLYQYALAPSPEAEFTLTSIEYLPDNTTKICGHLKGRLVSNYDYTPDFTFDIEGDFSYILQ